MPNSGITEYTKSILQKRGYVTASEIEAGGRTKNSPNRRHRRRHVLLYQGGSMVVRDRGMKKK